MKKNKNQITLFILIQILLAFDFFGPIEVLYFQNKGLSVTEIFSLYSLFSIFIFVLEIPSGYFADKLGRKTSMIISIIFSILGCFSFMAFKSFLGYAIGYVFFAINVSFMSGSDTAFLYDALNELGKKDDFDKYLGKIMSCTFYAQALAALISGLLAKINTALTLASEGTLSIIAIILCFMLIEPKIKSEKENDSFLQNMKKFTGQVKNIAFIVIAISVFSTSTLVGVKLSQPLLSKAKVPIAMFGIFATLSKVLSGITSQYAHIFLKKLNTNLKIIISFGIPILVFLIMFIFNIKYYVFMILLFIPPAKAIGSLVTTSILNNSITSEYRATLNSFVSFTFRVIYTFVIPVVGILSDKLGLRLLCGILAAAFAGVYLVLFIAVIIFRNLKKHRNLLVKE